jgi:hypothetical protein
MDVCLCHTDFKKAEFDFTLLDLVLLPLQSDENEKNIEIFPIFRKKFLSRSNENGNKKIDNKTVRCGRVTTKR